MEKINKKIKERSIERLNAIDWDNVLKVMIEKKRGAYSLSKIPNMPSQYDFQKKRKTSKKFNETYLELLKHLRQAEKVCPVCGKTFYVKQSKGDIRRTCSIKCMAKDFSSRGISIGKNRWRKQKQEKLTDNLKK